MNAPAPEVLRLRDGRRIEFARYGAESGPTGVFFHGFIGSHHQASFAHEAALRHGLRLIAPNRPYVGRTSPVRRDSMAENVADVAALAGALGLGRFAVMGVSGGVPYALACLARMPQRARVGVLISGLGPVGEPGVLARMSPTSRRTMQLGHRFPCLMRALIALRKLQVRADPEAYLAHLIRGWSVTDGEVFRRPDVRKALLGDVLKVFVEGAPEEGMSQELRLYFRWGFRLGDVAAGAKVLLWHGRDDVVVPPAMTLHAARRLPGSEVTLLPGGHFRVIGHAEELVRRTRQALGD